jgi:hypothetical protein
MTAILSVTTMDGQELWHTRKGLVQYVDKHKATKFKSLRHAMKCARKRYRLTNENLRGWCATTIEG